MSRSSLRTVHRVATVSGLSLALTAGGLTAATMSAEAQSAPAATRAAPVSAAAKKYCDTEKALTVCVWRSGKGFRASVKNHGAKLRGSLIVLHNIGKHGKKQPLQTRTLAHNAGFSKPFKCIKGGKYPKGNNNDLYVYWSHKTRAVVNKKWMEC